MSRSSTMSRSAVRLPTPGMRTSIAVSSFTTASRSSAGDMADSAPSASFGPTPETADHGAEQLALGVRREAIERGRVLAHLVMGEQAHRLAERWQLVVGRGRDEHFITHALHVHDGDGGLFVGEQASDERDHGRAGGWSKAPKPTTAPMTPTRHRGRLADTVRLVVVAAVHAGGRARGLDGGKGRLDVVAVLGAFGHHPRVALAERDGCCRKRVSVAVPEIT